MAITSAQIAVLNERMKGKVTDQIIRNSKLMMWAKKKDRIVYNVGGMTGIEVYVRYRNTAQGARAIGPFSNLTAKTLDDMTTLIIPWAVYGDALMDSKILQKRAKNSKQENINFDYILNQLNSFLQAFKEVLATDLWTGTGAPVVARQDEANSMLGLAAWHDNDNTIIGVNRAVAAGAYYRSVVQAITDPLGDDDFDEEINLYKYMRKAWNDASTGKQTGTQVNKDVAGERMEPNLTISDQASYELYENALGSRMRATVEGADSSYKTITHKQQPYDWDPFAPSATIHIFNTDNWWIKSVEEAGQLCSVYGEDETDLTKKVSYAGQIAQGFERPASCARCDLTLPT